MSYMPRGAMAVLLNAMRAEPDRIWTTQDAAAVSGLPYRRVGAHAAYAVSEGVMFRSRAGKFTLYALRPFTDAPKPKPAPVKVMRREWSPRDDYRVPKVVPGWRPPQMVCARLAANDSSRRATA